MSKFFKLAFMALLSIPVIFLFFFFYFPLLNLFFTVLSDNETVNAGIFNVIVSIITNPLNVYIIQFTFYQAILSTLFSIICGLPGAYILANYHFPGKGIVKALMTVPFVLPAIVVVLGFILVYGEFGLLNQITTSWFGIAPFSFEGTFHGVLMAHIFYNTPVVIRLISASWEVTDPEIDEVSRTLGSKSWHKFKNVTLPAIIPGLAASSLLVFIYCFTSFAIIFSVGGIHYKTLEVRIYESVQGFRFDFVEGAILALVQLITITVVLVVYMSFMQKFRKRESMRSRVVTKKPLISKEGWKGVIKLLPVLAYFTLFTAFFFLPLALVLVSSFIDVTGHITLEAYLTVISTQRNQYLGISPINQLLNTLIFSTIVAIVSVTFGLLAAFLTRDLLKRMESKTAFFVLFILPMTTSGIILAFSLITLYRRSPIVGSQAWLAVIIAHVLVAFPFINRTLIASFDKINPELVEVAKTLGANRWQIFYQVELPQLIPGMIVSASFAFAISAGEFGATYFIARSEFTTLAVGVYQFLATPQHGNIIFSSAMSSILIAVCVTCFLIIEKVGKLDMSI
ncbi:MAG: ABC transporter permease [Candidatus Hodarchaeales archaeon]|jgi:thiamine transport system permease protein